MLHQVDFKHLRFFLGQLQPFLWLEGGARKKLAGVFECSEDAQCSVQQIFGSRYFNKLLS